MVTVNGSYYDFVFILITYNLKKNIEIFHFS